jgi:outer membrane protein insertion porin family
LSFEEPWLFGKRWLGGVSLSVEHAQVPNIQQDMMYPDNGDEADAAPDPYPTYEAWQDALAAGESIPEQYLMEYTLWDVSLGFSMGYRYFTPLGWLGFRSGISTSLEQISYDPDLYRPFDATLRETNNKWSNINKLAITLFWDKRDYFLNPSKGYYVAQGVTFAAGFPLGTRQYIRTDSTIEGFATLLDLPVAEDRHFKMVLAAHSALSLILPQNAVAITNDLLYVDGWNVARGWPLETDKRVLWDNRLELRLPISRQVLWWTFFLDGVTAYDQLSGLSEMQLHDFLFSVGGGLRFTIPQFPIRLYLAHRFQWDDEAKWFKPEHGDLFKGSMDFVISLGGDTF